MGTNSGKDDDLALIKRDEFIRQYLSDHGIHDIEDAPDELIDAAHAKADITPGVGKDN